MEEGWRRLEIGRTASAEGKEVDVDAEIGGEDGKEDEEEEEEEEGEFDFFGSDGYFCGLASLPPLPPSPRPRTLTLETIGETSTDFGEECEDEEDEEEEEKDEEEEDMEIVDEEEQVDEAENEINVTRRSTYGTSEDVSEVFLEDIGETNTDNIPTETSTEDIPIETSNEDIPNETSTEDIPEVALEEELQEGLVEEEIFEKELTLFASEMKIEIRTEQSTEDLEYVASYFTFLTFARVIQPTIYSSFISHLYSTMCILQNMLSASKKESIGLKDVLKEPKKKAPEMLIAAFEAMKMRKITEVNGLLDDAKKRLEKDLKVTDISFRDRLNATRLLIFAECLLKCYSSEKKIFLPIYLMSGPARERMVKKIKKHLAKLTEVLGKKRNDSKWKKFGGGTVERGKDCGQDNQKLLSELLSTTCKAES